MKGHPRGAINKGGDVSVQLPGDASRFGRFWMSAEVWPLQKKLTDIRVSEPYWVGSKLCGCVPDDILRAKGVNA